MDIQQMIDRIHAVRNRREPCPICDADCSIPVPCRYGEVAWEHNCDCLLNLQLQLCPKNFLEPIEDEESEKNSAKEEKKKRYPKHCHKCGEEVGADGVVTDRVEDPPYKYECHNCGHSLRTHPDYGEGKEYDMAMFNITWKFDKYGKKVSVGAEEEVI